MKALASCVLILGNLFFAYIAEAICGLTVAFILGFMLDPFLSIIDVPFLTERFAGLGCGKLFIVIFTARLIIGILMPLRTMTGGGEK